jgi:hypothetical protein
LGIDASRQEPPTNTTSRRKLGLLIAVAAIAIASGIHWMGPGLIVTTLPPASRSAALQGINVQITSYHNALLPLIVFIVVGVLAALLPQRHANNEARTAVALRLSVVSAVMLPVLSGLLGYLAQYVPGRTGVIGSVIAQLLATIGVLVCLAALLRRNGYWPVFTIGFILSSAVSLSYMLAY